MDNLGKRRRISYGAAFKIRVVEYAEESNNNHAAARQYGVTECNVRRWRKEIITLRSMNKKRKSRRGKTAKWPELEVQLRQWIINRRLAKARVTTTHAKLQARIVAREIGIPDFKATAGWFDRFMKRSGLSVRFRTSVGQPLPPDHLEKMQLFRAYVHEKKAKVTLQDLINMVEVPCSFDMPGSRTIAVKGEEDISIVTTGAEKTNFTIILAVSANGEKLTPIVIFKRKTIPKEIFPSGIIVMANQKGWVNGSVMEHWMESVWMKRKAAFFRRPSKETCLLIYDACKAHLTDVVKTTVQRHTQLAVIPAGLTKFLQPLDISVNKSFKNHLRTYWDEWILNEAKATYTKNGKRRRPAYSTVCEWIMKAWAEVKPATIKNGFRRAGLHSYTDAVEIPEEEEEEEDAGSSSESENVEQVDVQETICAQLRDFAIDEDENEYLGDEFDGWDDDEL